MKRNLLALFVASTAMAGTAFAQEATEAAAVESSTAEGLNHWSFELKGGVDYFRYTDKKFNFEGGADVEYTFNPLWGLGIEYMYKMNNHDQNGIRKPEFDGTVHDIDLFASVNLSNLLAKYRSAGWQKLNIYANGGVGASIINWEVKNGADDDLVKPVGVLTGVIEYNVSKSFAIGLQGRITGNLKSGELHPYSGARVNGGANLAVRYKFGGENNIRNVALVDYEPKAEVPDVTPMLEEAKKQCEETTARLEEQIANQNAAIKKLQTQLKETQDSLDRHIQATKEPVRYTPTKEEDEIIKTAFSQLEFESAKSIIKQSSYSSLDGLAMLLKQHNEWSVILKGYTDNTGKASKNLQLSKDRSAAVKAYLVNKGVPASHIQTFGYGSANPVASNSTLAGRAKNRRVEIELYSK